MKTKLPIIIVLAVFLSLAFVSLSSALTISSISTSPSEIAPGETSIIDVGLENEAEETIKDVSVTLDLTDLPFVPYESSTEESIDEIKEDKTKHAEFEIKALNDAESGTYKIPLKISYYDEDGIKKPDKSSLISITVSSKPIVSASLEDGLLLKGQENAVEIKIVNKGLSDVKFLEVEMESSARYTILSQKSVYIGDIDSDDFDTAEFKIFFKENSPSTINLPVKVIYKDALNKNYEEEFSLQARVYTKEQAIKLGLLKKSNTTTYVVVIVILIIIYIIYRKIKKRRKMKKVEGK
mgnify:CR=1 FL=1